MGFQELLPKAEVSFETRAAQAAAAERARVRGGETEAEVHKVLSGGQVRARWKLELTFRSPRSMRGAMAYEIRAWESGKALNGEGDAQAFMCRDAAEDSDEGCRAVIPQDCVQGDVAICPACGRSKDPKDITDVVGGVNSADKIAGLLAKFFLERLNSDADIYLKFHKADPRYIAMAKAKGWAKAEKLKGLHIYPLARLMKDLLAGADLQKRMKAFILS